MDRIVYVIEESKLAEAYQAYCPELVVTAFGDTAEESKAALRREIGAYLIEAGFYDNDDVWMSALVTPPKEPKITIL